MISILEFYLGVCSITYKGCLISGFLLLLLSTLPLVFLIQIEDYIGEYHLSSDVRREMRSRQVVIFKIFCLYSKSYVLICNRSQNLSLDTANSHTRRDQVKIEFKRVHDSMCCFSCFESLLRRDVTHLHARSHNNTNN